MKRLGIVLLLALAFAGCSGSIGGQRTSYPNSRAEISALRSEREDLRRRVSASQMREDTQSFRNSAFPANGAMDNWQFQRRLSEIDSRIEQLEGADAPAMPNTSTQTITP